MVFAHGVVKTQGCLSEHIARRVTAIESHSIGENIPNVQERR